MKLFISSASGAMPTGVVRDEDTNMNTLEISTLEELFEFVTRIDKDVIVRTGRDYRPSNSVHLLIYDDYLE